MNKTLLTLLRDRWLILPSFAEGQQLLVNNFLAGKEVSFPRTEQQQPIVESRSMRSSGSSSSQDEKYVNVINLTGPILKYDVECGDPGAETVAKHLRNADRDPNVSGVVLNIDSPGGASTGALLLADTIKAFSKPIVASISHGYAASAAYWAASQCDEIYLANAQDSVGSIGAYCTIIDATGAYEKLGYKIKTIYAPQSKDKNGDYRAAIENDDTTLIEQGLFELVQEFQSDVKAGRGARLKSEDSFTGAMYNLNQALEQGLIDGQKNLEECAMRVFELSEKKGQNNSNNKSNHMPKTTLAIATLAVVLGWTEGFESTAQGISLTTEEANNLNTHLENLNAQISEASNNATEFTTAQERITELESELASQKTETKKYQDLAVEYGAKKSSNGTNLETSGDAQPPSSKEEKAMDSTTAEAMRIYNARNKNAAKK